MPMSNGSPAAVRSSTTLATSRPSEHDGERRVRAAERGDDVVDEPVGVRGQQHLHARGTYSPPSRPRPKRCRRISPSPARSWTSPASSGTVGQRPVAEQRGERAPARRRPPRPAPAARPRCATARPTSSPSAAAVARRRGRRPPCPAPNGGWTRLATPATRVDALVGELAGEPHRLGHRVAVRRGDDHVARGVGAQQGDDVLGPLAEPGLHAGERLEERHGVGEHVGADDLADRPQQRLRRRVDDPHARRGPAASAAGTGGGRGSGRAPRTPRGSRGRCGSAACRRRRGRTARRRAAGAASRPPCTPACR